MINFIYVYVFNIYQLLEHSAEDVERSVLTLGSLCLPCYMRKQRELKKNCHS